ncbi:MAG: DUF4926 domain-containing protein [Acidobacteriota bacterium]|nr:DUF4926 domain-containing protein [Acidobacteriota bacterium]
MFAEYQVVRLSRDLSEEGLKAGARGAVLMVHPQPPGSPRDYEVEFVDEDGATLALLTLAEDQLEPDAAG